MSSGPDMLIQAKPLRNPIWAIFTLNPIKKNSNPGRLRETRVAREVFRCIFKSSTHIRKPRLTYTDMLKRGKFTGAFLKISPPFLGSFYAQYLKNFTIF